MTTRGGRVGRASWYDPGDLIRCQNSMSVPNPYRPLNYSSCSHHYAINTVHRLEGKKRRRVKDKVLTFIPSAYCLLVYIKHNNLFVIKQRINTVPACSVQSGPVQSSPVYLLYIMQCIGFGGLQITWYYQVPWANPVSE